MKKVYLRRSHREGKKYVVTIIHENGRRKTVHFGAEGMSDYTKHKDYDRMLRYIKRHKKRENWKKSGVDTAGFWAKWLLWSKTTLKDSIKNIESRFNVKIYRREPPNRMV